MMEVLRDELVSYVSSAIIEFRSPKPQLPQALRAPSPVDDEFHLVAFSLSGTFTWTPFHSIWSASYQNEYPKRIGLMWWKSLEIQSLSFLIWRILS
ncbi:hypothetical protein AVEN_143386-1 [Araneus ventricosus]|uniref:Uncharacterized protein n=1 Tax=Araneus ventricosus TaxID=182803 RepID=A0A4Y2AE05_ARAVE|nr:hypothetical protein AVEN_143386-1 [Araneus ventricosus]